MYHTPVDSFQKSEEAFPLAGEPKRQVPSKNTTQTREGENATSLRSQHFIPIILSVSKTKPKLGIGAQSYNPDYSGRLLSLKAVWTIWQDQILK